MSLKEEYVSTLIIGAQVPYEKVEALFKAAGDGSKPEEGVLRGVRELLKTVSAEDRGKYTRAALQISFRAGSRPVFEGIMEDLDWDLAKTELPQENLKDSLFRTARIITDLKFKDAMYAQALKADPQATTDTPQDNILEWAVKLPPAQRVQGIRSGTLESLILKAQNTDFNRIQHDHTPMGQYLYQVNPEFDSEWPAKIVAAFLSRGSDPAAGVERHYGSTSALAIVSRWDRVASYQKDKIEPLLDQVIAAAKETLEADPRGHFKAQKPGKVDLTGRGDEPGQNLLR